MAKFNNNRNFDNQKSYSQVIGEYGKVPPNAGDLEELVLGALLIDKNAIIDVVDVLKVECFYKEAHQKIYQAILELSRDFQPIDLVTIVEKLRTKKELELVGGAHFISDLTSRVASSAHIEYHAKIIVQKHIQRELIKISSEIQNRAFDEASDVNDLLDFSEQALFSISSGNTKNKTNKIDEVIVESLKQIEEAGKREDGLSGVPSGYTSIDRVTSGWQRSDLVILAARPAMGKTSFVLSMARNMAVEHNQTIAVFSLEMSCVQLVNRLISAETELGSDKIKNGNLTPDEWVMLESRIKKLVDAPMFIDETPAISVFELRAKARRLKTQHDLKLIIIDYLQLMSGGAGSNGSREQEVSMISRSLKALAKDLDVPIIALSQLNRSVESRSGNRPQLSDLRESGAIEQDADMVLFIHRPEYFGITEDEEGNSTKNMAEIIFAKNRNGATCTVPLKFRSELAKFEDFNPDFESLEPLDDSPVVQTFSSKMNEEPAAAPAQANDDFSFTNTGFDSEPPF